MIYRTNKNRMILKKIKRKIKPYIKSWHYYGNLHNSENAMLLHQDFCSVPILKEQARTQGLKLIDDYVDTKKKSDTIFIFGSGESVNYLTAEHWEEIKKHNTLGLNYFFVHDFVPDYFMIEMIRSIDMQVFFNKVAYEKAYQNVDMFIQYEHAKRKDYDFSNYPFQEKMWVHVPYKIPALSNENFKKSLLYFEAKKGISLPNIIHHRSHIDCTIQFAYILGYKKIVLIGVDLNLSPYFTSLKAVPSKTYPYNEDYNKLNVIRDAFFVADGRPHLIETPTKDKETVAELCWIFSKDSIHFMNDLLLKPHGVSLFVSSKVSSLSEFLPVYFDK